MRLRSDKSALQMRTEEGKARNLVWSKLSTAEKIDSLEARDAARTKADGFPWRYESKRQMKSLKALAKAQK